MTAPAPYVYPGQHIDATGASNVDDALSYWMDEETLKGNPIGFKAGSTFRADSRVILQAPDGNLTWEAGAKILQPTVSTDRNNSILALTASATGWNLGDPTLCGPIPVGTQKWDGATEGQHALDIGCGVQVTVGVLTAVGVNGDFCYVGNALLGPGGVKAQVKIAALNGDTAGRHAYSIVCGDLQLGGGSVNNMGRDWVDFEPLNDEPNQASGCIEDVQIGKYGLAWVGADGGIGVDNLTIQGCRSLGALTVEAVPTSPGRRSNWTFLNNTGIATGANDGPFPLFNIERVDGLTIAGNSCPGTRYGPNPDYRQPLSNWRLRQFLNASCTGVVVGGPAGQNNF